jgi:hypothetical protein
MPQATHCSRGIFAWKSVKFVGEKMNREHQTAIDCLNAKRAAQILANGIILPTSSGRPTAQALHHKVA